MIDRNDSPRPVKRSGACEHVAFGERSVRLDVEARDSVGGVEAAVERVQVIDPLGPHVRDETRVDEREPLVSPEEALHGRERVRRQRLGVEPRVFLHPVEEVDGGVVAHVRRQAVERLRGHVVYDYRLRELSGVDPPEDRERVAMRAVPTVAAAKSTVVSTSARGIYSGSAPQASCSVSTSVSRPPSYPAKSANVPLRC
jgi:hypothetical protein